MGRRMTRAEVDAWYAEKSKLGKVVFREDVINRGVPGDGSVGSSFAPKSREVLVHRWEAPDGSFLELEALPEPEYDPNTKEEYVYVTAKRQTEKPDPAGPKVSENDRRQEEEDLREKEYNQATHGVFMTHRDLAKMRADEEQRNAGKDQARREEERLANEKERLQMEKDRLAAQQEKDKEEANKSPWVPVGSANGPLITERNTKDGTYRQVPNPGYQKEEKPLQPVATPEGQKKVGLFNPNTGKIEYHDNENYNEALERSKELQEKLRLAVSINQMSADQAKQVYDRWHKENIETPFAIAREERERMTAIQAAQKAEQERQQHAANYEMSRQQFGQKAASDALDFEKAMQPYRSNPKYGREMARAINVLATGGDPKKAKFSSDAFDVHVPDPAEISEAATARALQQVSPYAQAMAAAGPSPYQTPQFSTPLPTAPTPWAAPPTQSAPPINIDDLVGEYYGTP